MASGSQPRDEAGILKWPKDPKNPEPGELDPQQYAAARKAHELFVGMANIKAEEPQRPSELDSFLPRLDATRRNHTVLIDGTRGSGKTCVMLRLLQIPLCMPVAADGRLVSKALQMAGW
jgi:predicted ATPase